MEKCIDQDCIMHDHLCEFDCAMSNEDMNICEDYKCLTTQKDAVADIYCSDGLVTELEDVKRLIESDTLITACSCYSDKTNGSMSAFFALNKVRLRVEKIIDKISN